MSSSASSASSSSTSSTSSSSASSSNGSSSSNQDEKKLTASARKKLRRATEMAEITKSGRDWKTELYNKSGIEIVQIMNKVTDEEWPSFAAYWYIDFVKNRISRLRGAEKPLCWLTGVGENIVSINMVNKRSAVQDIWGGKAALQSMLRLNLKHKGLIISLQSIFARALANGFWYIDDENIIRARKHLDENAAEIIIPIPETYPPKPLLKAVAMKEEHKKMIRAIRYFAETQASCVRVANTTTPFGV